MTAIFILVIYRVHLGNVRLTYADTDGNGSINASSEIISEKNYYPFGLQHKGYNGDVTGNANSVAQNFKYNGKELNEELGLNIYDYHARMYDPAIGRTLQLDPHAYKYAPISPYNYTLNSPVNFTDPDGKDFRLAIDVDDDGNFHLTIQSTVNTYGKGSSEGTAAFIQSFYDKLGGSESLGDGNTLSFDITVKHHDNKEDAIAATEGTAGDNLFELSEPISRKDFNLYDFSDRPDGTGNELISNPGFAVLGGREGKAINAPSAVHEIGHLFGLGDRYTADESTGGFPVNNKGFGNDIMGNGYPLEINKVHYQNLYNHVIQDVEKATQNGDTRTIPYTNIGGVKEDDK